MKSFYADIANKSHYFEPGSTFFYNGKQSMEFDVFFFIGGTRFASANIVVPARATRAQVVEAYEKKMEARRTHFIE